LGKENSNRGGGEKLKGSKPVLKKGATSFWGAEGNDLFLKSRGKDPVGEKGFAGGRKERTLSRRGRTVRKFMA